MLISTRRIPECSRDTQALGTGEVTAPVVYAHSGNPEDYALLRKHGIDVKGKIVLVRYSNPYSYRGFKALTAEREGAAAMIVYSDPQEDGYKRGKVFPDGPWGPESHIQRGAITYDFIVPGDPLTPGWASIEGAKRIPIEQAVLSQRSSRAHSCETQAFSRKQAGRAPKDWQGACDQVPLGGAVTLTSIYSTTRKPNYSSKRGFAGPRFEE